MTWKRIFSIIKLLFLILFYYFYKYFCNNFCICITYANEFILLLVKCYNSHSVYDNLMCNIYSYGYVIKTKYLRCKTIKSLKYTVVSKCQHRLLYLHILYFYHVSGRNRQLYINIYKPTEGLIEFISQPLRIFPLFYCAVTNFKIVISNI